MSTAPCFRLLCGCSGSGKTSTLQQLVTRFAGKFTGLDLDDCRPPKNADEHWWGNQIEELLKKAAELQSGGKSVVMAGWTTYDEGGEKREE